MCIYTYICTACLLIYRVYRDTCQRVLCYVTLKGALYIYMYIYIYTHVYIYILHIYLYIETPAKESHIISPSKQPYTYIYTYVYMHVYICVLHVHLYIESIETPAKESHIKSPSKEPYTYIYTYVYMHVYIYVVHVYVYIHLHKSLVLCHTQRSPMNIYVCKYACIYTCTARLLIHRDTCKRVICHATLKGASCLIYIYLS